MIRRLLLAALALFSLTAAASAQEARRPFSIYMVLSRGWDECAQGFKDYLADRDIPVDLIIRDAGQDKARLPGFVSEAKRLQVDLVFTMGAQVSRDMLGTENAVNPSRHITDIPAIFAMVPQPLGSGLVSDLHSSGRNITGSGAQAPMQDQVEVLKSYGPLHRLGMIYNPQDVDSLVAMDDLKALESRLDFQLQAVPVDISDGNPVAAGIPAKVAELKAGGADFLYIPAESFLDANRDALTAAALAQNLPSFAAGEGPVLAAQAMFGAFHRHYTLGQLSAMKAEQILVQKKKPANIPIDTPKRLSMIINMPVARALGFYPPMTLLGRAELLGQPVSGELEKRP